ncbi:MAG: S1/P1 nuclease [Candidatus Eremiobacteraeota bacterium]|nr:S1/P1 nuclease [Candidatus Eremiobacteraeota bacterium]
MKRLLLALITATCLASPVHAWNAEGHRTVAEVAGPDLSPRARAEVRRILHQHPDQDISLAEAAVWPDKIRDDQRYDHPTWHYTNIPFFDEVPPRQLRSQIDVRWAINHNTRILKDRRASLSERAIALSWLAHLIGDIHQPLHATSRFAPETPDGDRGGNDYLVHLRPDDEGIKLHSYWDAAGGLYLDGANRSRVVSLARDFRDELPRVDSEVAVVDPRAWADESHDLATDVVYKDLHPGDVLSNEYISRARQTSKKRMTLAGYRLADFLNRVF